MKTVAITGDMGSGKSMVSRMLADYDIPVYDSDEHAKRLLNTPDVRADVEKAFPNWAFYNKDGSYNTDFAKLALFGEYWRVESVWARILIVMAKIVDEGLCDKALKKFGTKYTGDTVRPKFGGVLGRHLVNDFWKWAGDKTWDKPQFVVFESAILYEYGLDRNFDRVIFVDAPLMKRMERAKNRSLISPHEYKKRMSTQMDPDVKKAKADFVINNDTDSKLDLRKKVDWVFDEINLPSGEFKV